ncbi:TolC family protein [Membranihabitans marinus]|uniref:TolC family protein n=1 Tax=Membranihabitans marinus TaxID=1227546 RepID=UPI001F1F8369|nr:TolC family protein [Membranihabitans marinus]
MKTFTNRLFPVLFLFQIILFPVIGQNFIGSDEAVKRALENNFGIKIASNNLKISENNTSKWNTGQLPTVSLDGGANFKLDNSTVLFQDGRQTNVTAAASESANASLNVGYTLFDGYRRKYNIAQLQDRLKLNELQVKATLENVAAQTLFQYYQVAALSQNIKILTEVLDISAERLHRSEVQYEYGGNQLAILNAQVDLNNDSLNLFNAQLQLENAKRNLNNIIVDLEGLDYSVEDNVEFLTYLSAEDLKQSMLANNIEIRQMDKNIEIGNLDINLAEARKLPTFTANGSYGITYSKNNAASLLSSQSNNGLNLGVTMKWNLFDAGATKLAIENAKVSKFGLELEKESLLQDLNFEFENAWADYENKLLIYRTEVKNVEINRTNFLRTEEKFKIGQVNSVDFRQAQLNLLNAETNMNTSKFEVKIAEVQLLLLSGQLLQ